MSVIFSVLYASLSGVFKLFLLLIVGLFISLYPKGSPYLSLKSLQALSMISNIIFLPASIIATFGQTLTMQLLNDRAILILLAIIVNFLSYSIGNALGYFLNDGDRYVLRAVTVAIASPNCLIFPLILAQTLCEQPLINSDYNHDSYVCNQDANSLIYVYMIGWNIAYFTYFASELQSLGDIDESSKSYFQSALEVLDIETWRSTGRYLCSAQGFNELLSWIKSRLATAALLGTYIGIIIGIVPELKQKFFFENSILRPFGSTIVTLGEPLVCVNCLILASSIAHMKVVKKFSFKKFFTYGRIQMKPDEETHSPIHHSNDVAIIKNNDVTKTDTLQRPFKLTAEDSFSADTPSLRIMFLHNISRLVLAPILILGILLLLKKYNLYNVQNRLLALIVCIEASSPTAIFVIVLLNQLKLSQAASMLGYLCAVQYFLAIFTMTFWVSLGLLIFYDNVNSF